MSQKEQSKQTGKPPRTQIEDIPRPHQAVSEEEAALVIGGAACLPPKGYSTCSATGDDRD